VAVASAAAGSRAPPPAADPLVREEVGVLVQDGTILRNFDLPPVILFRCGVAVSIVGFQGLDSQVPVQNNTNDPNGI